MKDKSTNLLNSLISGDVTPEAFRELARQPNVIICMLIPVYTSPPCPSPDDPAVLVIDGTRKETLYSEWLDLKEKYPDACLVPPLLFVCCSGCLPGDPCHCIAD